MEFNEKDFMILRCAQPDNWGYINDDRALELMDLGYIQYKPKEQWRISSYQTTEKGTELYLLWLKEIRENHGHNWETYEDYEKRTYRHIEGDTYSEKEKTEPFSFAFENGYHNGYVCKNCKFSFCLSCINEWDVEKCSKKKEKELE